MPAGVRMTRVKICGIRRVEDAVLAAELGASAIGLVFWPGSPRFVELTQAQRDCRGAAAVRDAVGVFVDQPWTALDVAQEIGLSAVQFHGDEAAAAYPRVPAPGDQGGRRSSTRRRVKRRRRCPAGATVLLDAHDRVKRGGTGRAIDWIAAMIAREGGR